MRIIEIIKEWYAKLSGATKFIFILCILFTVINSILIAVLALKSNEVTGTINSFYFTSDKQTLFSMFGLSDLFDGFKLKKSNIVVLLFNIGGYYISYCIGKIFGFFKSITEMLTDIKNDGWGYFSIMFYNAISLFFDIVTITSFIMKY